MDVFSFDRSPRLERLAAFHREQGGGRKRRSPGLRRRGLNGGNGSIPVSVKSPLPALAQAGTNSEVDPIRMRVVDLSTTLPSRDPETMGAKTPTVLA